MKRFLVLGILALTASVAMGQPAAKVGADVALTAPVVITGQTAKFANSARRWQGIPGLERTSRGRLWAVWYSGGVGEGPDNFLVLVSSEDGGRVWSKEKLVVKTAAGLGPVLREFDPCLWVDPSGRMWLFWAQSFANFDARTGVWAISTGDPDAASPKWTAPRRYADGIMLNKPVALSAKHWLLPVGMWRHVPLNLKKSSLEASGLTAEQVGHKTDAAAGSELYETTDGFKTVRKLGGAEVADAWFDEHMVVTRKDGSLWMLVRTRYGIGGASSTDGGKTWNASGDTGLGHVNSRFFLRRLKSGNLLLVSNMPPQGTARTNMVARLSSDDGKTWSGPLVLDERTLVSYPDGVEAEDGQIDVIYDRDREGDGDILLATFTEEDVRAGKIVSAGSRLMQVVDTLSGHKKAESKQGGTR